MAVLRALSSTPPSQGGVPAPGLEEAEEQPSLSSSSLQQPTTPCRVEVMGSEADVTPSLLRHSGRQQVGADGSAATDEDSMVKAMRSNATRNLDFGGTPSCKSFMSFDNSKVSSNITRLGCH